MGTVMIAATAGTQMVLAATGAVAAGVTVMAGATATATAGVAAAIVAAEAAAAAGAAATGDVASTAQRGVRLGSRAKVTGIARLAALTTLQAAPAASNAKRQRQRKSWLPPVSTGQRGESTVSPGSRAKRSQGTGTAQLVAPTTLQAAPAASSAGRQHQKRSWQPPVSTGHSSGSTVSPGSRARRSLVTGTAPSAAQTTSHAAPAASSVESQRRRRSLLLGAMRTGTVGTGAVARGTMPPGSAGTTGAAGTGTMRLGRGASMCSASMLRGRVTGRVRSVGMSTMPSGQSAGSAMHPRPRPGCNNGRCVRQLQHPLFNCQCS
jgi:hypothetical protein